MSDGTGGWRKRMRTGRKVERHLYPEDGISREASYRRRPWSVCQQQSYPRLLVHLLDKKQLDKYPLDFERRNTLHACTTVSLKICAQFALMNSPRLKRQLHRAPRHALASATPAPSATCPSRDGTRPLWRTKVGSRVGRWKLVGFLGRSHYRAC